MNKFQMICLIVVICCLIFTVWQLYLGNKDWKEIEKIRKQLKGE